MRKLATIRRIEKLEAIPNADRIWKATIGGWEVVTAKDNGFQVGDKVIFLEVDSFVPHEVAPFLSKGEPREFNGIKGERLKTIRLKNQLSQGLILPLSVLDGHCENISYGDYKTDDFSWEEGYDVSEILQIQKYEKPLPTSLMGKARGNFPSFIPKTDQERCQNLQHEIFETNKDTEYEVTVKLDGSSMTVYHYNTEEEPNRVGVCSRNLELKLDQEGNAFVDTVNKIGLMDALKDMGKNIAIQGELCGKNVQGNKDGFDDLYYFVYDIFDIDSQEYLPYYARQQLVMDLQDKISSKFFMHVPILHSDVTLEDLGIDDIKDLLKFADGKSYFGITQANREGLVFKAKGGDFSFKAISNQFLEKTGE